MIIKPETGAILRQNVNWIVISLIFFLLGMIIAYIAPQNGALFGEIPEGQRKILQDMAQMVFEGSPLRGIIILFVNNIFASLQVMFLGILLGIPTLLGLFANGALVGYIMKELSLGGVALFPFISLGILPHGIFELPAFFISTALGLKLGFHLVFPLPNKKRGESLKYILKEYWTILPLVVSLLIIAAIIEVLVTPALIQLFIMDT